MNPARVVVVSVLVFTLAGEWVMAAPSSAQQVVGAFPSTAPAPAPTSDVQVSGSVEGAGPASIRLIGGAAGGVLYDHNKVSGGEFLLSGTPATTRLVMPRSDCITLAISGSLIMRTDSCGSTASVISWQNPQGNAVGMPWALPPDPGSAGVEIVAATPRGVAYVLQSEASGSLRERRTNGSDVELLDVGASLYDNFDHIADGDDIYFRTRAYADVPMGLSRVAVSNPGVVVPVSAPTDDVQSNVVVSGGVAGFITEASLIRVDRTTGARSERAIPLAAEEALVDGPNGVGFVFAVNSAGSAWMTRSCTVDADGGRSCTGSPRLVTAPADPSAAPVQMTDPVACEFSCALTTDGSHFYTVFRPQTLEGGLLRVAAGASSGTIAVAAGRVAGSAQKVALTAGRVVYADDRAQSLPLMSRALSGVDAATLGPEIQVSGGTRRSVVGWHPPDLSASGSRIAFIDITGMLQLVTGSGPPVQVERAQYAKISGLHLLYMTGSTPPPYPYLTGNSYNGRAKLRNLATGVTTVLPPASYDLWGPYLASVAADGSLTRRNLVDDTTVTLLGPDPTQAWNLGDGKTVSIWGEMAMRHGAAAEVVNAVTGVTTTIRSWENGFECDEGLREYRMGDGAAVSTHCNEVRVEKLDGSGSIDVPADSVAQIDGTRLAYEAVDGTVHVRDLGLVQHPRFLSGNTPAYATRSAGDVSWATEFVFTDEVGNCTLTIVSGATTIRTLPCTGPSGDAASLWDGRDEGGSLVPAGTYSWQVAATTLGGVPFRSPDGTSSVAAAGTVIIPNTSVQLSPSVNPSVVTSGVTLTAQVTSTDVSGTPTGSVTFLDGTTVLGVATLSNGTAALTTSALTPGAHQLTSVYGGGGTMTSSTSPPVSQQVNYTDVPVTGGFGPDIYWLTDRKIATGFADGSFRPANSVTRQAFAAYLYRYTHAGVDAGPCPAGTSAFSDVPESSPFCGDIAWLASTGITGGFADGTFRPAATVTRQAVAAFFYRLNHAGADAGPCPAGTSAFPDVPDSSPFCGDIAWLASTRPQPITTGFADGGFHPGAAATRQATAAYFHRYDNNLNSPVGM